MGAHSLAADAGSAIAVPAVNESDCAGAFPLADRRGGVAKVHITVDDMKSARPGVLVVCTNPKIPSRFLSSVDLPPLSKSPACES